MKGHVVKGLEIIVPIRLLDGRGDVVEVDFVIDTGSTAELTLPPEAIEILGLKPLKTVPETLANDTVIECTVYAVRAFWHGQLRTVEVTELDSDALLGMRMMSKCRVTFDVIDGGSAELTELRSLED